MIKKYLVLLLLLACAGGMPPVFATKPCWPHPCFEGLDCDMMQGNCEGCELSVAVGKVTNVQHDVKDYGGHIKDFATFTFVIERWLYGERPELSEVEIKVGCCDHALPENREGDSILFWDHNILLQNPYASKYQLKTM